MIFFGCRTSGRRGDSVLRVAVEYAQHGNLRDFLRQSRPACDCVSSCSSSSGVGSGSSSGGSSSSSHVTSSQCQRCADESKSSLMPLKSSQLLSFAYQTARGMQFLASSKVDFIIIIIIIIITRILL